LEYPRKIAEYSDDYRIYKLIINENKYANVLEYDYEGNYLIIISFICKNLGKMPIIMKKCRKLVEIFF